MNDLEDNEDLTRLTFDDMDLKENILRGIYSHGFETPSSIQQKGILPVSRGLMLLTGSIGN